MPSDPRNRHERRSLDAGHDAPRTESKWERDGLAHILAFPIAEVPQRLGISRSTAYLEIAAGRLVARKCGARTLITSASAQAWLDSLPKMAA
jgi:hypothetical protein